LLPWPVSADLLNGAVINTLADSLEAAFCGTAPAKPVSRGATVHEDVAPGIARH
jgi:hypothetical protein